MFFNNKATARNDDTPQWRGLQYILVTFFVAMSIATVVHTSSKAINTKFNAVSAALKRI